MHTFYSNWRPVSNSHISFPLPGVTNDTKKIFEKNRIDHLRKLTWPGIADSIATNDGDICVGKLSPRQKLCKILSPNPRIIGGNEGQMYFLPQEYDEWKFKL